MRKAFCLARKALEPCTQGFLPCTQSSGALRASPGTSCARLFALRAKMRCSAAAAPGFARKPTMGTVTVHNSVLAHEARTPRDVACLARRGRSANRKGRMPCSGEVQDEVTLRERPEGKGESGASFRNRRRPLAAARRKAPTETL